MCMINSLFGEEDNRLRIDQNFSNFPDDETDHGPKIGLIPDPTLSPELNDEMDNELCDSEQFGNTIEYH
ncbi:Sodium-Coupled Neutral Amino Acid Transporter 10-Like [Manis pentadactyla]|nr:Sodium-Coupled Neutral Amino Acid Transporter 10-Like [Manis pentadactyla]